MIVYMHLDSILRQLVLALLVGGSQHYYMYTKCRFITGYKHLGRNQVRTFMHHWKGVAAKTTQFALCTCNVYECASINAASLALIYNISISYFTHHAGILLCHLV